jgi:thymidylate synthase (FAD)
MAELTRHRLASFCIRSQRYVDESRDGGIEFIRPLFYKDEPDDPNAPYSSDPQYYASMIWHDQMENIEGSYAMMRKIGIRNEDARKVLPNSTMTSIMMKINLRELLHIYKLRSAKAAYPEMVECMRLLKEEVDKVLPGFLPEDEEK